MSKFSFSLWKFDRRKVQKCRGPWFIYSLPIRQLPCVNLMTFSRRSHSWISSESARMTSKLRGQQRGVSAKIRQILFAFGTELGGGRGRKRKQCSGLVNSPNDDKRQTRNDNLSSINVAESDNHLRGAAQPARALLPARCSSAQSFMFFKVERKVRSHPASVRLEGTSVER